MGVNFDKLGKTANDKYSTFSYSVRITSSLKHVDRVDISLKTKSFFF